MEFFLVPVTDDPHVSRVLAVLGALGIRDEAVLLWYGELPYPEDLELVCGNTLYVFPGVETCQAHWPGADLRFLKHIRATAIPTTELLASLGFSSTTPPASLPERKTVAAGVFSGD